MLKQLEKRYDLEDEWAEDNLTALHGQRHGALINGEANLDKLISKNPEEWVLLSQDIEDVKALSLIHI